MYFLHINEKKLPVKKVGVVKRDVGLAFFSLLNFDLFFAPPPPPPPLFKNQFRSMDL